MRIMLLIYNNDATAAEWSGPRGPELQAAHRTLLDELAASGELVQSSELAPEDACVVVKRPDSPITVDPVATDSGVDRLGGYYLVDVPSRERAIEIASRLPEIRTSYVELRHVPMPAS